MKSNIRLLAITGSHRKDGNSYSLVKSVLKSVGVDHEIIQLAEKDIEFCTLCGQCVENDCVLEDDLDQILRRMEKADGIVFAVPKYLLVPSKFLAFLERLDTIVHMRRHKGYEHVGKELDYRLFSDEKPFCILALSGTGNIEEETLKIVADYIEALGLKPVSPYRSSLPWFSVRAGDAKGEVLKNAEGREQCKQLVEKLVESLKQQTD
jgi:multimeric flavodoxin WrbA